MLGGPALKTSVAAAEHIYNQPKPSKVKPDVGKSSGFFVNFHILADNKHL